MWSGGCGEEWYGYGFPSLGAGHSVLSFKNKDGAEIAVEYVEQLIGISEHSDVELCKY